MVSSSISLSSSSCVSSTTISRNSTCPSLLPPSSPFLASKAGAISLVSSSDLFRV